VLLSAVRQVAVRPTVFLDNFVLDMFPEEDEHLADSSSDGDHGDILGANKPPECRGSSSNSPMACACYKQGGNGNDGLMVCPRIVYAEMN
jgi:hypothetical protein